MSVSVIVPTKNEQANIAHLLESLPAEVQLVLCDASTDATRAVVAEHRPINTLIVDAPGSIAEARQRGALTSSGDILVFSDADVEFDSSYFDRLAESADWDGVCGAKLSPGEFTIDYTLMLRAQTFVYRCLGIAAASGSNMAIKREAFMRIGGFRPHLRCNEDTELFLRGGRWGLRLRFDEQLIVWARDHRRLQRGRAQKIAHSVIRNCLLYLTCRWPRLPRLLEHDWGYWSGA
jgi:glycosyltransferase involved in cell wall biosynthesis